MFQFPVFPILSDHFRRNMKSHSEISGSKPTCGSPEHFAACHILLRLIELSPPPNSEDLILSMHGFINMNSHSYLYFENFIFQSPEIANNFDTLHSKSWILNCMFVFVCLDLNLKNGLNENQRFSRDPFLRNGLVGKFTKESLASFPWF